MHHFISPPGLDMSAVVEHGDAVLLAWAGDYSPVKPLRQFTPRRSRTEHVVAAGVPVQSKSESESKVQSRKPRLTYQPKHSKKQQSMEDQ